VLVWADAPDDVWGIREQGGQPSQTRHYDGLLWSIETHGGSFGIVWGTGPDNVFVDGWHWNGLTWAAVAVSATIGGGPTDTWNVGSNGFIAHLDGTTWTTIASGVTSQLNAVWADAHDDAYAVGDYGVVLHWNGSAWSLAATPLTQQRLSFVWGSGPADVYVVGQSGVAWHWDGTAWTDQTIDALSFSSLSGAGPHDVFATAGAGELRHNDGTGWTPVRTPGNAPFNSVFASRSTVLLGYLLNSAVLHRDVAW
jgi:hypothetical protein